MDLEQVKLGVTLAIPFIKEIVEKYISPNVKELIDKKGVSIKMTSHSFENQFNEYLKQSYSKFSTISIMALSNQKRLLKDIYIPLRVVRNTRSKETYLINEFSQDFIPRHQKVLVIDTAGMGKSTMVKRLFLAAVEQRVGVPMVIELRRLSKTLKIIDEIFRQLSMINEKANEKFVLQLIRKGGFIFMLDGFDEIEHENRKDVVEEIRNFIDKAGDNYFLLTSRREDSLSVFSDFVEFNIEDLSLDEAYQLLSKHDDGGEVSALLINKLIEERNEGVADFLYNPLLVSLLYAAFEYKQAIPLKKHMFYRQVYDAFFERHDLTKGESYTRVKYSRLESDDFSRILRYIGYHSMMVNKIEFTKDELLKIVESAKKYCVNLKFNASDFIQDLLTKVPLFVADGLYLKWSHKSIQEYFAANFIFFDAGLKQGPILVSITKDFSYRYLNVMDLYYDIDYKSFRRYVIYEYLKSYISCLYNLKLIWPDIKGDVATSLFCEVFLFIKHESSISNGDLFGALDTISDEEYGEGDWGAFSVFNENEVKYNYMKVFSHDTQMDIISEFFISKNENFINIIDGRKKIRDGRNDDDSNYNLEPTSDYNFLDLEKGIAYTISGNIVSDIFKNSDINSIIDNFYFYRKCIDEKKALRLIKSIENEISQEQSDDFLMPD